MQDLKERVEEFLAHVQKSRQENDETDLIQIDELFEPESLIKDQQVRIEELEAAMILAQEEIRNKNPFNARFTLKQALNKE